MKKREFLDLEQRKKVWIVLSDLFLDTDTKLFHENIIKVLVASPYNIGELKNIMLNEVHPVCRWNLINPIGEWAGFDEEWLVGEILKEPSILSKVWIKTIGKLSIWSYLEWRKILKEIKYRRTN